MKFRGITLEKLAGFICGNRDARDENVFPYRTSSQLTRFFHDLDLDYAHNGSTRQNWVEWVLGEIAERPSASEGHPPEDFLRVICYLLHPDHFVDACDGVDRAACVEKVRTVLEPYGLRVLVEGGTGEVSVIGGQAPASSARPKAGSTRELGLPDPPPEYDPVALTDYLKTGLVGASDGGLMPTDQFLRIRKILMGNPAVAGDLPGFISQCREPREALDWLRQHYAAASDRRAFIRDSLNGVILKLEADSAVELANYENLGPIGSGGFGHVYRFRHRLLEEDFAVKVFAPAFAQWGAGNLERFFREARILCRLNHPNIIRFFEAGLIGRRPYFRMEFFAGLNLTDLAQQFGRLPVPKVLVLVRKIAEALEHAHGLGIVHRDLKPSNVMIAKGEQVRVIDFGLGVFVEGDLVSRITKTGEQAVAGLFTAPELIEDPKLIVPASDIYSLGAIWYSALTGRAPSGARVADVLAEEAPDLPVDQRRALLRCMEPRATRFHTASELLAELARLRSGGPS